MRNSLSFVLGLILSAGTISSAISAENTQSKKPILVADQITVYATRSKQSLFNVPAMASVIKADEAGNSLSSDVADLLEFTAGVEVDNGPRRNGQNLAVRGFDNEAVLTLIDGRRQNFEAAHDGRFYIDPSLLKSVEIVRGASSSSYGGGAVGGVVAFETKDAADLLLAGKNIGAQTSLGFRTGNHEFSSLATGYAKYGDLDIVASGAYRTDRDIGQGNGAKLENENNLASGLFKISNVFADKHHVKFEYQGSNNKGHEPNNGAGAVTSSNPIVNKEINDSQFSLKYAFEDANNNWLTPKLHLYHNITEVEEGDITGSNAGRIQTREIKTTGLTLDNQSTILVSNNHEHKVSYGLEYYNDEQKGFNNRIASGTRAGVPNATADNSGFYLQDEVSFKTAIGELNLIPAARYDKYESNDNVGNSQDEDKISPKLAFSYKPIGNVNFFGSWAQAFRAPNLTELYPSGQHYPGNNFVANPDLKPETVETIELGLGLKFASLATTDDKFQIKGSWYSSKGKDFISQTIGATTTQNINIAKAVLTGFEIESQYQIKNLVTKFGLSYTEAENDQTGEYLTNNVPLTFVSDIGYRIDSLKSTIGWRGRFADENDKAPSGTTKTAGYAVHDIYYRWNHENAKGEEIIALDLGVENIFDKSYTKRFATLKEEGRSVVGKISYKW